MKTRSIIGIICVCLLLQLLSGCGWITSIWESAQETSVYITNEPIIIGEVLNNPLNSKQYDTEVFMTTVDGKLYFRSPYHYANPFSSHISVFADGSIESLYPAYWTAFCTVGPYIYYYMSAEDPYTVDVYCFNVQSGEEQYLLSSRHENGARLRAWECYFEEDGILYILKDDVEYMYYPVVGTTVGEPTEKQSEYRYGSMNYVYQTLSKPQLTGYDQNGNAIHYHELIPKGVMSVIPCESGLLIHNLWYGNLLYFVVGETGELITLFEYPCDHSYSALNAYGDYAYFSVLRFRDYDLFAAWFPGDDKYGTYRINLNTLEMEKINDNVYRGLYIFDDTGIYACDQRGCIYKLDFDGNVIMTLLEY